MCNAFCNAVCVCVCFQAIKTRFSEELESETAILAAVTLPWFQFCWLKQQERKDNAKASLLAECRKSAQDEDQLTGTNAPTRNICTNSAIEDDFFSYEDEEDTPVLEEYFKISYEFTKPTAYPMRSPINQTPFQCVYIQS